MAQEYKQDRTDPLSQEEIDKIVYLLEHDVPVEDVAERFHVEVCVIQILARMSEQVTSFR